MGYRVSENPTGHGGTDRGAVEEDRSSRRGLPGALRALPRKPRSEIEAQRSVVRNG
ncbi:MAG: hypothetical protein H0V53_03975 [Rubrobacter sp.]|nr:hypothetical protein [Rubrobacter sp.]